MAPDRQEAVLKLLSVILTAGCSAELRNMGSISPIQVCVRVCVFLHVCV